MSLSKQPRGDEFVAELVAAIDITRQRRYGAGTEASDFAVVIDAKRCASSAMEQVAMYDTTDHEFGNYWLEEYLWKTAKGNWLLSGHGGSGTPWWDGAHSDSWGLGFIALTEDQVKAYLQARQMHDVVIEQFPVEEA
jgi:hypothetical protein